jgi:hypothetical protein
LNNRERTNTFFIDFALTKASPKVMIGFFERTVAEQTFNINEVEGDRKAGS